ncbi:MAG: pyridoxamine 5'-phosphate oxidase family protein [Actinobacteria bacterium]|nr:pyridoxamine 5'-phosphate oxidase family protein [Actinomycetota bacterium]
MTAGLPPAARSILDGGRFCYVAVPTPDGPHVTPVVYVLSGGRIWVTTARSSVKARSWRRDARAAGLVVLGGRAVTFRGTVRTFDALDPLSWPAAVAFAPRIARAATRFTLKNARFFAGYAVDARRVPLAWTPPGRVFAELRLDAGRVLFEGGILEAWGEWMGGTQYRSSFARLPDSRGIDGKVPPAVRDAVGTSGVGALATDAGGCVTVLPVRWRRVGSEGSYDATLPASVLDLARVEENARSGLAVDRASRWRASAMTGMLLRGEAQVFSLPATRRGRRGLAERLGSQPDGNESLVRIRPGRVVWWSGWRTGTVTREGSAVREDRR